MSGVEQSLGAREAIVVVGNGMVGHRFCDAAEVGASEVHLSPEWKQRLFDLIVRERDGVTTP